MFYLVLFIFAVPVLAEDAEWTGPWFPKNPAVEKPNEIDYNLPVKSVLAEHKNILEDAWEGKWFPADPKKIYKPEEEKEDEKENEKENELTASPTQSEDKWQGKWFPKDPESLKENNPKTSKQLDQKWQGKWFPQNPNELHMGIADPNCDDGKTKLEIDFDPRDPVQSDIYMCLEKRTKFHYNFSVQPILTEHIIPPSYSALHKCMNETIEYQERLPTFGTHRRLWLQYGEYLYAPPQRWVHNLEHGAIVMLYHPCADYNQIEKLKMLVKNCLYRHVITSSNLLLPERPLAILAWGKSLEMSVIEPQIIVDFIKKNALKGSEKIFKQGQYVQLQTQAAKVVSDEQDSLLCPNNSY